MTPIFFFLVWNWVGFMVSSLDFIPSDFLKREQFIYRHTADPWSFAERSPYKAIDFLLLCGAHLHYSHGI